MRIKHMDGEVDGGKKTGAGSHRKNHKELQSPPFPTIPEKHYGIYLFSQHMKAQAVVKSY